MKSLSMRSIAVIASSHAMKSESPTSLHASAFRSTPVENARPAPVSTTTRTSDRACSSATDSMSSRTNAASPAFRTSGRSSVTRAHGPSTVRWIMLRNQRRAGDRRRLLVVPLRGRERVVDLLERILVREDPGPRPALAGAHEELERLRDDPRVVLDDADDLLRSPHEQRGLEVHLGAAADRADLE